jgi:hypothetical protein
MYPLRHTLILPPVRAIRVAARPGASGSPGLTAVASLRLYTYVFPNGKFYPSADISRDTPSTRFDTPFIGTATFQP